MKNKTVCHAAAAATLLAGLSAGVVHAGPALLSELTVPGNATDATDLMGGAGGANVNRLGGFGSDLVYDRASNVFFGLVDRGPGGGLISYSPRIQEFALDINPSTGVINGMTIISTTTLKQADGTPFNGLNPFSDPANGNSAALGRSLDPEGLARLPNGNFLVSEEYGPRIREFSASGALVREFTTPANLIPKDNLTNTNYVAERQANLVPQTLVTGRQDNRGFEGLTVSPDGTKAYAILQDPLAQEGNGNQGRRGRIVRIVEFDVATGTAGRQFAYLLEPITDINSRIPGTADDFGTNNQGRSIGVSSIIALSATQFLVLERDNRGIGNEDSGAAVGSKRIFSIDIGGASDISGASFAGLNELPGGVTPVSKSLWLDIQAELVRTGRAIYEKYEGMTFGPDLSNGLHSFIVATDNDFSVTQSGSGTQFDVCHGGGRSYSQVAIDTPCTTGGLIPSSILLFAVPEPGTAGLVFAGLALLGIGRRTTLPKDLVVPSTDTPKLMLSYATE